MGRRSSNDGASGPKLPAPSTIKNMRQPDDPRTHRCAWLHPVVEHLILTSPDDSFQGKPPLADPSLAYKRRRLVPVHQEAKTTHTKRCPDRHQDAKTTDRWEKGGRAHEDLEACNAPNFGVEFFFFLHSLNSGVTSLFPFLFANPYPFPKLYVV
jgi:hypothetical protein